MVTCLYLLQPPAGPLLHIPRPQRRPDVSPRRRLPGAARRRGPRGCGGPGTAVISSDGLFVCIWISIYLHIYIRWRFTRGSILTRGELWLSSTRTTLTMCLIISSRVLSSQVCSSAVKLSIGSTTGCTITKKAPTRAFSWLKAATTAFTFKTLLRHYAKRALTPR